MKFALAIFMTLSLNFAGRSQTAITNGAMFTFNGTSYDTDPYHLFGDYMATHFVSGYAGTTNDFISWSESGNSFEADWKNTQQKFCLPDWSGARTNQIIDFSTITENGGYTTTNPVIQWFTNIAAAPPFFWNGTDRTNEGVAMAVTHYSLGPIPDNGNNVNPGNVNISFASGQLADMFSVPPLNTWSNVYTPYWSNDFNLPHPLSGFYDGGHPYPAGHLCMALTTLTHLTNIVQTNVWAFSANWPDATVGYNSNCTLSSLSLSAGTLSFNVKFARQAMAWDVAGTVLSTGQVTTNDARDTFTIMPFLGNAFNCIVQVSNAPPGKYIIFVNGILTDSATDVQLAAGRNWFTNYNGPIWSNRVEVLTWKRHQEGVDCVTLFVNHSPGSGQFLAGVHDQEDTQSQEALEYDDNGNRGTNYVRLVKPWIDDLKVYDNHMAAAALQPTYSVQIVQMGQRLLLYHR